MIVCNSRVEKLGVQKKKKRLDALQREKTDFLSGGAVCYNLNLPSDGLRPPLPFPPLPLSVTTRAHLSASKVQFLFITGLAWRNLPHRFLDIQNYIEK